MTKSIFCVKWRWFDEHSKELPSCCVTHSWYTSYRKAHAAYEKALETLYSNYPERRVESTQPEIGFSTSDGTYELEASKVYAKPEDKSYLRVVLAAADIS